MLRSFAVLGIGALAAGLILPSLSQAADIVAGRGHLPGLAAESGVAGNSDANYSYFLTPFKLASQPNLKQSIFGFGGRTNSGNVGDTFSFGVGAPQRIFYDNYIVGGA